MAEANNQQAKDIVKTFERFMEALQVLKEDVKFGEKLLNEYRSTNEQTCRRFLIRAVCATIEGTLAFMKNAALQTSDLFQAKLTDEELQFLTGHEVKNGVCGKPIRFPSTKDNIVKTLNLFSKAHGVQMEINFKESGFLDLEETFKLRNRLMHPKSHLDIEVTNAAFETSIRGVRWFDSKGVSIMDASMQNIKTQLSRK